MITFTGWEFKQGYQQFSKGILGDFSLICELNCYQTISSPICL